jgi:hypothetical protein
MNTRVLAKVIASLMEKHRPFVSRTIADEVIHRLTCNEPGLLVVQRDKGRIAHELITVDDLIESILVPHPTEDEAAWATTASLSPESRCLFIVHRRLQTLLQSLGVTAIDRGATHVNYALHDPVRVIPTEDEEQHGCISAVLRTGYIAEGRVLRQMMVIVRKYVCAPTPNAERQQDKE